MQGPGLEPDALALAKAAVAHPTVSREFVLLSARRHECP